MRSKNQYLDEKDLSWYFVKPFLWQSVETFYRISYTRLHRKYCGSFNNLQDFEDLFQLSILKLWNWDQGKKLKTCGQAFYTFRIIFDNNRIDLFKKNKRNPFSNGIYYDNLNNANIEDISDDNTIHIEDVFLIIDNELLNKPSLLSSKERVFYTNFKYALLTYVNTEDIMSYVTNKMNIDKGYFGKLKFQLVHLAKDLIKQYM